MNVRTRRSSVRVDGESRVTTDRDIKSPNTTIDEASFPEKVTKCSSDPVVRRRTRSGSLGHNGICEQKQASGDDQHKKSPLGASGNGPTLVVRSTRLRNGIEKPKVKDVPSREELLKAEREREALIDGCARDLALIDERGYRRALLRDANAVLETIMMPMSCPWSYHVETCPRTMPRDIDELFQTYALDIGEESEDIDGSASSLPTATRTNDSGVIELTTYPIESSSKPTLPLARKATMKHPHSLRSKRRRTNTDIPGELSLKAYEEVQNRKKIPKTPVEPNTVFVSVRFASTSSRESIFQEVPQGYVPLLRSAQLPREVLEGRHVKHSTAACIALPLGTYDCRHGLPPLDEKPVQSGRSPRVHAGRTRLMWSTKASPASGSDSPSKQRSSFESLITGKRMGLGGHKRPREVKVGVRINGQLICLVEKEMNLFNRKSMPNSTDREETESELVDVAFRDI